ncbi:hypothetical protein NPIL_454611 [Nephila pilipes]|uniref:Uncharacterized protein n=1 Tax=Nephila pilipes TaxID=299642 RepID=A0A8X6PFJ4_NEPPI|nr:hypothetical protein NPIL_454611 [Nephila pilipes]
MSEPQHGYALILLEKRDYLARKLASHQIRQAQKSFPKFKLHSVLTRFSPTGSILLFTYMTFGFPPQVKEMLVVAQIPLSTRQCHTSRLI